VPLCKSIVHFKLVSVHYVYIVATEVAQNSHMVQTGSITLVVRILTLTLLGLNVQIFNNE